MDRKIIIKYAQGGVFALFAMVGTHVNAGLIMDIAGGFECTDPNAAGGGANVVTCTTPAPGSGQASAPPLTYANIAWTQTDDPQSSMELQFQNGLELQDGVLQPIAFEMIFETNNVIDAGTTWNLDLLTNIHFRDHVNEIEVYNEIVTVNVDFTETNNAEPCNSGNPSGPACSDLYIATFPLEFLVPIEFSDANFKYSVQFIPSIVNGFICAPGDVNPECPGLENAPDQNRLDPDEFAIYTEENVQSILSFNAIATKTAIPEPGTLSMLALGLLGFGAAARRRRKERT